MDAVHLLTVRYELRLPAMRRGSFQQQNGAYEAYAAPQNVKALRLCAKAYLHRGEARTNSDSDIAPPGGDNESDPLSRLQSRDSTRWRPIQ